MSGTRPGAAHPAPVSWTELVRRLRDLGFDGPYRGGRHLYMVRDGPVLTIPDPNRGEIGVDLLGRLLRQAGVSRDEWEGEYPVPRPLAESHGYRRPGA